MGLDNQLGLNTSQTHITESRTEFPLIGSVEKNASEEQMLQSVPLYTSQVLNFVNK